MDDSDNWLTEEGQKEPQQKKIYLDEKKQKSARGGRRGRNQNNDSNEIQSKKQCEQIKRQENQRVNSDQSNWIQDNKQKQSKNQRQRDKNNEPKVENELSLIQSTGKQLEREMDTSVWGETPQDKIEEERGRVSRGNRGNRNTEQNEAREDRPQRGNRYTDNQFLQGGFKKKTYDNDGYRNFNDSSRGGYQGRGRGRGRGGNYDRYREENERPFDNYNRGYNNEGRRPNDRDKNEPNNSNIPYNSQGNQENVNQNKQKSKLVKDTQSEQKCPRGRKCWPEFTIYLFGCRLSLTFRQIGQCSTDVLVIPYKTTKMEYYPGNIINSSSANYREKIIQKGKDIQEMGKIYLQKCVGIGKFKVLAFMKIDDSRISQSLQVGIKNLLHDISMIRQKTEARSILFPISEALGNYKTVLQAFSQQIEMHMKLRQVYLLTNNSNCFIISMKIMQSYLSQLMDSNEICIDV